MSGINKVIVVGRLGANPDSRTTPGGQSVANLNIATSENWTDKNGQRQERTEWHRVVVWGKLADLCKQYLTKGRQVYVEGKLQTRSWEDKEGQKRYTTEIIAQTIQFLGAGNAATQGDRSGDSASQFGDESAAPMEFSNDSQSGTEADIPF